MVPLCTVSVALALVGIAACAGGNRTTEPTIEPPVVRGPAPAVHVQGNALATSTGSIRLRGVNHSGTEYACIQGWGIFDGAVDSAAVAAMASWKSNVVRVPLNESCWLGINGAKPEWSGTNYRTAIATYVGRLNAQGFNVILELHWTGAGTTPGTGQQPMPNRANTPAFWASVATAYKGNDAVLFDLFNEPFPDENQNTAEAWRCWRDGGTCAGMSYVAAGMQELISAIRATGATNVIMLGGVQYANSLTSWLANKPTDPLDNLAASWHVYSTNLCNSRACWDTSAAPVAQRVPLILGEIGDPNGGSAFNNELMDWMDARQGSYLAWVWNVWGSTLDLITSYDGTASNYGRTFQTRFRS